MQEVGCPSGVDGAGCSVTQGPFQEHGSAVLPGADIVAAVVDERDRAVLLKYGFNLRGAKVRCCMAQLVAAPIVGLTSHLLSQPAASGSRESRLSAKLSTGT
jgi:hypothetical protein